MGILLFRWKGGGGGDEVKLKSDKEGKFTISCLSSLIGTTVKWIEVLIYAGLKNHLLASTFAV